MLPWVDWAGWTVVDVVDVVDVVERVDRSWDGRLAACPAALPPASTQHASRRPNIRPRDVSCRIGRSNSAVPDIPAAQ